LGQKAAAGVLAAYFLFQVLMPLRQFYYPGNLLWTSEGYFFSWRMLTANRDGEVVFFLRNKTNEGTCEINTRGYLYAFQRAWIYNPDVMIQFAEHLASEYRKRGAIVAVHAWSNVSLNGRSPRALVDPEVDLASVGRTFAHHTWLTDVDTATPLERPRAERCPDPADIERARQLEQQQRGGAPLD
jgi:hypothetical protein